MLVDYKEPSNIGLSSVEEDKEWEVRSLQGAFGEQEKNRVQKIIDDNSKYDYY